MPHPCNSLGGWFVNLSKWWVDEAHKPWVHEGGGYTEYQTTTVLWTFLKKQRLEQQSSTENVGRQTWGNLREEELKKPSTIEVGKCQTKLNGISKWTSTHRKGSFLIKKKVVEEAKVDQEKLY